MAKLKGKCPTLIAGNHGKPKFEIAKRKRTCKRCKEAILAHTDCVVIPKPGTMGKGPPYCYRCFHNIIKQTQKDLDELKEMVTA